MKFRKKPVVIDAVQFNGKNFDEIEAFVGGDAAIRGSEVIIATLEGAMHCSCGDWIIKGVKSEFYPCKPDIFKATYDRVESAVVTPREDAIRDIRQVVRCLAIAVPETVHAEVSRAVERLIDAEG